MISGDRGGQGVRPSLPVDLFGNVASKNQRTCKPPVWRCTILLENYPRNGKKLYVCIPLSVLVINVCIQGKTLCSPYTLINREPPGQKCWKNSRSPSNRIVRVPIETLIYPWYLSVFIFIFRDSITKAATSTSLQTLTIRLWLSSSHTMQLCVD